VSIWGRGQGREWGRVGTEGQQEVIRHIYCGLSLNEPMHGIVIAQGGLACVSTYSVDSHQYYLWVAYLTEEMFLAHGWVLSWQLSGEASFSRRGVEEKLFYLKLEIVLRKETGLATVVFVGV